MDLISCPPLAASICHACETMAELRAYTAFADEYRKAALTELSHPEYREAGLMALLSWRRLKVRYRFTLAP